MKKTLQFILLTLMLSGISLSLSAQVEDVFRGKWQGDIILLDGGIKAAGDVGLVIQNKKERDKVTLFLSRFGALNKSYMITFGSNAIDASVNTLTLTGDGIIDSSGTLVKGEYTFTILNGLFSYPVLYGTFAAKTRQSAYFIELILFPAKEYRRLDKSAYSEAIARVHNHMVQEVAAFRKQEEEKRQQEERIRKEKERQAEEERLTKQKATDSIRLVHEYQAAVDRLFANTVTTLNFIQKVEIFKLTGFKLDPNSDSMFVSGYDDDNEFPFDAYIYNTDFDKDGREEIFISYGNPFTSGRTGNSIMLLMPDYNNKYWQNFDFPGLPPECLKSSTVFPDLLIPGPGFQYPVWKWDGQKYNFNRQVSDDFYAKNRKKLFKHIIVWSAEYQNTIR